MPNCHLKIASLVASNGSVYPSGVFNTAERPEVDLGHLENGDAFSQRSFDCPITVTQIRIS
jgi:hypothetical protein